MRFVPVILCIVGAFLLLSAFGQGSGASLPYQDPTPDLLAIQSKQIHTAWVVADVGAGLLVAGIVWQIVRWWLRPRTAVA